MDSTQTDVLIVGEPSEVRRVQKILGQLNAVIHAVDLKVEPAVKAVATHRPQVLILAGSSGKWLAEMLAFITKEPQAKGMKGIFLYTTSPHLVKHLVILYPAITFFDGGKKYSHSQMQRGSQLLYFAASAFR